MTASSSPRSPLGGGSSGLDFFDPAKVKIGAVVLAYFAVSISLVFSNKLLLSNKGATIEAPMFITWFQCVFTAVIIYALGYVAQGADADSFMKELPNKKPEYKLNVARDVFPLSAVFVGMIAFNNLCLQYVEVSFYNVARSLTIVFNVVFTYFLLGEKTSKRTCFTLLLVIVGFFVGSNGEVNFNWTGTLCGVASSAFVCLNAIYTSKVMPLVDKDKWKLAYYNNANAAIMFVPLILVFETKTILNSYEILFSAYFWVVMCVAGVLGFLIGIVTVMQIQHTSPLTHNISGTAKACVQTVLAYIIWQNDSTLKGNVGVMLVIAGSGLYAYVRMQEMDAAKAQTKYMPLSTASASPTASAEGGKGEPEAIELRAQQKV